MGSLTAMPALPRVPPVALARGALALVRAGLIRPVVPRPALLGLALELPLVRPSIGLGVALQAALQPSGVAVLDERGMVTWGELDRRVTRLANVLLEHGGSGGSLAFLLRNGREAVECYAAGGRSGLAPVPLNTSVTGAELARILHMQRPDVLVADVEFADAVRFALRGQDDPPLVLQVGGDSSYEAALAAASTTPPFARGTTRIVTHTSGTSAAPKGAERQVGLGGIVSLVGLIDRVPLRRSDRMLIAAPLFHAFAQGLLGAAVVLGAGMVLPRRFDADTFEPLVHRERCTVAGLVPVMLRRILETPAWDSPSPLRIVVTSGSVLSPGLRDRATERFGDVVYDLYGSTEAGFVAISTPEDHRRRRGTVGRPTVGVRLQVLTDDGRPAAAGEVGHLVASTGLEFAGFTGSGPRRGAVDLGDLGYLDDDGYLFVTGRSDEMVVSGGENVYPAEVEEVIRGHEQVVDVAVLGVPDEEYGEVLVAYVVGDVDPEGLRDWLHERLSRFKVPKRVVPLDRLPRNATGKVLKRELTKLEHPARRRGQP